MRISDWSSDVCSSVSVPGRPHRSAARAGQSGRAWQADAAAGHQHHQAAEHQRVGEPAQQRDQGTAGQGLCDSRLPGESEDRQGTGNPPALLEGARRSEEHTSELQSLMRISYAVFCLKKKTKQKCNTKV